MGPEETAARADRATERAHPDPQGAAHHVPAGDALDHTRDEQQVPPRRRRGTRLRDGSTLYWWRELLIVATLYVVYESIRDISQGKPSTAFHNALRIIDWQQALSIYHEKAIQDWALNWTALIVASNYFYGSAYIGVSIVILVWLYRRFPDDYPLLRNTLAIGTMLGLVGFAAFPLMPPRLLDVMGDGQVFGYVDTLVKYPTFWSFESPAMQKISNQFAAMPSLHCGWAVWGMGALLPRVRTWWMRTLAVLYPIATTFVVVATGNHYFLDAVGGAVIFAIGYGVARLVTRAGRRGRLVNPAIADR
jgi:hypothetical protein